MTKGRPGARSPGDGAGAARRAFPPRQAGIFFKFIAAAVVSAGVCELQSASGPRPAARSPACTRTDGAPQTRAPSPGSASCPGGSCRKGAQARRAHAGTRTYAGTRVQGRTHACTRTQSHTHVCRRTQRHARAEAHPRVHTHARRGTPTGACARTYAYFSKAPRLRSESLR